MLKFPNPCLGIRLSFSSFRSRSPVPEAPAPTQELAPYAPGLCCKSFLTPRRQHSSEAASISMENDGFLIKILDSICLTFYNVQSIAMYYQPHAIVTESVIVPVLQTRKLGLVRVACPFQSDKTPKSSRKDQKLFSGTLPSGLFLHITLGRSLSWQTYWHMAYLFSVKW